MKIFSKRSRRKRYSKKLEYSKKLIDDVRGLLWLVTLGGIVLAAYSIHEGYLGSLPWLSAMVGLPWSAHGVVCSFYLNMAKSDHSVGGITYAVAEANQFQATEPIAQEDEAWESPAI